MNENDIQAKRQPPPTNVIPFPAASRPGEVAADVERHLERLANRVGGSLLELVATADAHGLALPPAVRQAALALDPSAPDLIGGQTPAKADSAGVGGSCDAELLHAISEEGVNRIQFIRTVLGVAGGLVLKRFDAGEPCAWVTVT